MASFAITFLLLILSAAGATSAPHSSWRCEEEVRRLHKEWMADNGRSYRTLGEEKGRSKIFRDNLRYIDERNAAADRGEHTFRLGLTPFADLTVEEYRATYLGLRTPDPVTKVVSNRYLPLATDNLPDSVDWREKGAVAAIKYQGQCGGCWAFSAVSTVESINKIVTGNLVTLSEQQLIDCDDSNHGCDGGSMEMAFQYIITDGGIASDETYPFKESVGTCNSLNMERVVSIDSFECVESNDEQSLKKAVANQPISVRVGAASQDFQLYESGIFTGNCTTELDHGVVVVGYGTENGKDYWIMRNSWNTNWGEDGYMRIERNTASSEGKCGIAMTPSYPIKAATTYLTMPEGGGKST